MLWDIDYCLEYVEFGRKISADHTPPGHELLQGSSMLYFNQMTDGRRRKENQDVVHVNMNSFLDDWLSFRQLYCQHSQRSSRLLTCTNFKRRGSFTVNASFNCRAHGIMYRPSPASGILLSRVILPHAKYLNFWCLLFYFFNMARKSSFDFGPRPAVFTDLGLKAGVA